MDGFSFDRLVRRITEDASRRGVLKSAFAATVAGLGVTSLPGAEETEAAKSCKKKCKKKNNKDARKKCKKRCKKKDDQGKKQSGELCDNSSECAEPNNICALPLNDSGGDERCCGATGAVCGGANGDGDAIAPICCQGFVCSTAEDPPGTPGVCQPVSAPEP